MARTTEKYCFTCDSYEEHRKLDEEEQAKLRRRLGRSSVNEFLVCVAPDCFNLRTGWNKRPFPEPIRLSELNEPE
ncbi:hypothetical protein [Streptomyces cavernicola]|uniref:HNH endonuclease n=1 Tax=Streptomyces cavernicola TaxID=3043613 RepID=A0ABT6SN68_9ACTN|nr:hypothetical protein [Streptomyces sp. B-S-A6]MDI3409440.1 hypothetical protein [Streptomyces sp. B-S-A6]